MTKKVKNDGTYSIKRRLSIAEKVIIIYLALFSFPLGLSFSTFFIKEINPLDGQVRGNNIIKNMNVKCLFLK